MSGNLNLIHFLDFYFSLVFLAGLIRRVGQYRAMAGLALSGPGRWPLLWQLVKQHRTIFMTWATVLPGLLALLLSAAQIVASRAVWPDAGEAADGLTFAKLLEHWPALLIIVPVGLAMVAIDVYGLITAGGVNRAEMEKYFEQAEYWLRSSTAHVVRVFTLGYINPRRMVADEVQKSLIAASQLLNASLWWLIASLSLRVTFGLSLWLTWAWTRGNSI